MKLKKIASLALAGVMAVSMLAGCKGNNSGSTGDQGNTVVETATSDFVKALNNAQIAGNDVKIDFTADSKFDADLAAAVKRGGQGAGAPIVCANLELINGIVPDFDYYTDSGKVGLYTNFQNNVMKAANNNSKDGKSLTFLTVKKLGVNEVLTEEAAITTMAKYVEDQIAQLEADTDAKTIGIGGTYFTYAYTGKAAMAKTVKADGTTDYYFAVVMTQSCTKVTKTVNG